ncbi:MAG: hypothetical protein EOS10_11655 [Mesorhizobium sp.]|uniref:DUF6339 family protein n=1 Tax=Mesorhizobium sp. TaxID=1871066 RepID=UPI000FE7515B|nr:DUF6339 family protein [Mesorhizobium sp.]RWO32347.1 MAG: hypothetical protein EOS10_11655 [Mesorhizobium sp.]
MTKIRILRHAALGALRADVERNLSRYRDGDFEFLRADLLNWRDATGTIDEEALRGLKVGFGPEFELENCQAVYASLPQLTPYEARDERLWTYFCHVQLLDYSRNRWPIPEDDERAAAHIRLHFFARDKRGIERNNAVSRLWWMAHLCSRVVGLESTAALRILLEKTDIRANIIERPTVSQSVPLFSAILCELAASQESDGRLLERAHYRRLMAEINSIGGYRLLDYLRADEARHLVAAAATKVLVEAPAKARVIDQATEAA